MLTGANLSYTEEHSNVELGLLVHDVELGSSIEPMMRNDHSLLYEREIS